MPNSESAESTSVPRPARLTIASDASDASEPFKARWIFFNGTGIGNKTEGTHSRHVQDKLASEGWYTIRLDGVGNKYNPPGARSHWTTLKPSTTFLTGGATGSRLTPRALTPNAGFLAGAGGAAVSDQRAEIVGNMKHGRDATCNNLEKYEVAGEQRDYEKIAPNGDKFEIGLCDRKFKHAHEVIGVDYDCESGGDESIPVVLSGFSRGAAQAIEDAHDTPLSEPVYLVLHDPNAGYGRHNELAKTHIPANVKKVIITYSVDSSKNDLFGFTTPLGIQHFQWNNPNVEVVAIPVQGNHIDSGKTPRNITENSRLTKAQYAAMQEFQAALNKAVIAEGSLVESVEGVLSGGRFESILAIDNQNSDKKRVLKGVYAPNSVQQNESAADGSIARLGQLVRDPLTGCFRHSESVVTSDISQTDFEEIKTASDRRLKSGKAPLTWQALDKVVTHFLENKNAAGNSEYQIPESTQESKQVRMQQSHVGHVMRNLVYEITKQVNITDETQKEKHEKLCKSGELLLQSIRTTFRACKESFVGIENVGIVHPHIFYDIEIAADLANILQMRRNLYSEPNDASSADVVGEESSGLTSTQLQSAENELKNKVSIRVRHRLQRNFCAKPMATLMTGIATTIPDALAVVFLIPVALLWGENTLYLAKELTQKVYSNLLDTFTSHRFQRSKTVNFNSFFAENKGAEVPSQNLVPSAANALTQ